MILKADSENRRAKFKLFNASIESRANDINHVLFEELIMLDTNYTIEEKITIAKYYTTILKAYRLSEAMLKEILTTNPDNKAANEEIANVYLLINKQDEALKKYEFLKETHGDNTDYLYNLLDVHLKTKENLNEAINVCTEIVSNKGNLLLAYVVLEYVYTLQNNLEAKEEASTDISKYIFASDDKVATIKTILKYKRTLNRNKSIRELAAINYNKTFECKRGQFKNKKEAKKIKGTIQNKLTNNLMMQTHNFYVYCINSPAIGKMNKNGTNQTLDYIIVIAFNNPKGVIDIFPSIKLDKEK